MSSSLGFVSRNYKTLYPPQPPKDANAVRFGILGAATVAGYAFINPARSHPGVKVEAIAARDPTRAKAFAKKNGIPRVFNSYQELLDDPNIDVIYNPLPNGLHYEWTMKALKAGKHVLLEKPAADTSAEVAAMFRLAKEKNLVLLEARHYRFHPAIQTVKNLIQTGTIGKIKGIEANMGAPAMAIPKGDIRRNLSVGGGCVMDMGGYVISASRYLIGADPTDVLHIAVNTFPEDPKVDRSTRAVLAFPNDVAAAIYVDFALPPILGFIPSLPLLNIQVDGEEGSIYLNNFIAPSLYHGITIKKKGQGEKERVVKAYTFKDLDPAAKGETWWTSYRYQLEAFVDKVQGRKPQTWISEEDSLANMAAIESIYENSGLGIRPASTYVPE